jgi:hypothetical protein
MFLLLILQVSANGSDKDEIEKLAGAVAKVGLSQCMQVLNCWPLQLLRIRSR